MLDLGCEMAGGVSATGVGAGGRGSALAAADGCECGAAETGGIVETLGLGAAGGVFAAASRWAGGGSLGGAGGGAWAICGESAAVGVLGLG
jgi:hypothetical protein